MEIRLLRHATLIVKIGGFNILVDPMLSEKFEMEPVANAKFSSRIPMVDFPFGNRELMKIIQNTDAVIVTHIHRDHWDLKAAQLLRKTLPVFCQPGDEESLERAGFINVIPVNDSTEWQGIKINITNGHHGTEEIEKMMGKVSGFVLRKSGEPLLYIAGDTIWCREVEDTLRKYSPDTAVFNSGEARFLTGGPITMDQEGIKKVIETAPRTKVIAVHFETVNHCMLTRDDLKKFLKNEGLSDRVIIPSDGDSVFISLD